MNVVVLLQNPPDTWQGTFPFTLGMQIGLISGSFKLLQQVTTPGISGGSIPTFSGVVGGTTSDGTVIWTCVGVAAVVDPYPSVWLVPPDWTNFNNMVEVFGAGSPGGSNASAGGGGGAAYSAQPNITLTPGALIDYTVGVSSAGVSAGGDSWFGAATYAASLVAAKGGQASGTAGPGLGGDPSLGIGTTRIGGGGGGAASGGVFTDGGGGGGGAAGVGGNPNVMGVGGLGGDGGNVGGGGGGLGGTTGVDTGGGPGGPGVGLGGFPFGGGGGAGGGGKGTADQPNGLGGVPGGGGGGASFNASASVGGNGLIVITYRQLPIIPGAWLVINEPSTGSPPTGGGYTDRTNYLFLGEGHQNNYTVQMRQRGQATIHLIIKGNDTYAPTRGSQVFLFDQIGDDFVLNFSGLIQNIENQFFADSGDHFVIINAVSFESVLDTVLTTVPIQFFQMTCGEIVKELFNTFEVGAPISLGNIEDGATIELLNTNFDTISSLLDELATSSNFIWGVNPATLQLYFQPPYTTTAPFTLTSPPPSAVGFGAQFGTINWKQIGNDYRNRQAIRINPSAFSNSTNYYQGAGQLSFTLSNPATQVVNAWVTVNTPNYSVGTFTGNPSPGDTLTIEFPYGNPATTWQPLTKFPLGAIIIDPGNFVQTVTVSEGSLKSGATEPVWNEVTGGTTTDDGLIWTCGGPQGLGTNTAFTYTFVEASALDNTQFGQIVIGNTVAETVQNVQYALMAVTGDAVTYGEGINYSLPTWENGIVNTTVLSSTEFQCTSKTPGYSQGKCLFSTTSLVLSFNPTIAAGGSTPDEGLGNGQPGTITIAVGVLGTAIAAPGLAYQPGSADVSLATPLNSGSNLQVEYTRADGDTIQVENTTLVKELALITQGTGKYQAIVDYSDQLVTITAADALLQAQQILAAYSVVPQRVTFTTYQSGLSAGQALTISVTLPTGAVTLINGVWVIEEINAEIEPCELQGLCSGIGHYKSIVSCINIQQIASYLDFWKQVGGGSSVSGSGSGTALVSTGGGSTTVPGTAIELEVNGTDTTDQTILNLTAGPGVTIADEGDGEILFTATAGGVNVQTGSSYTATAADSGKLIVFTYAGVIEFTLPTPPSAQWNIFVQSIGAGATLVFNGPGGVMLDGLVPNDTELAQLVGIYITTDGTNYFSSQTAKLGVATSRTGSGTVNATAFETGTLQTFSNNGTPTLKLLATIPFNKWCMFVQYTGSGSLTINPNGLNIDGSASSLVLTQGQGVIIFTDGTNYFTMRGMGSGGGTPGGSNTQVQYNNSSAFGGITGATTDGTNLSVTTQSPLDNSTKAASTAYTDTAVATAVAGINPAVAVQAATTTAGDTSGLTYNNGASGVGATFTGTVNTAITIDGYTFTAVGQRLLVKNDTQSPSGAFNGVYYVTQIQTSLLPPILTRALDYDQPSDINNTGAIPVINGTVNGSTSWVLTSQVTTVGTSPLTYAQFSYAPSSLVQTSRNINTTAPLAGGGNLASDLTLSVGKASSSVFGVVEVDGTTITASGGVISAAGGASPPGMVQIAQQVATGSSGVFTFSAIPGRFTNLKLVLCGRSGVSADFETVNVQFNSDTGAHYAYQQFYATSTTGAANTASGQTSIQVFGVAGASALASLQGWGILEIPSYAGALVKMFMVRYGIPVGAGAGNLQIAIATCTWNSTAAITAISLTTNSGSNFVAGTVATLYGEL